MKNYIFSKRRISKPKIKIWGKSSFIIQYIIREDNFYQIWNKEFEKSYIFFFPYKIINIKNKLLKYKRVKV